jgi:streptogramin lyase
MRGALAVCLVLLVSCSGSAGQPSSKASPSRTKPASGGVIEYAVPPAHNGGGCGGAWCGNPGLQGITSGRDGNVWFVDVGNTTVGRVTPAGVITEFPVPGTGVGPEGIVGAPDGSIWMVAPVDSQLRIASRSRTTDLILKISPQGVVTRFPLAGAVDPDGITWGPDGNIWFTEQAVGKVGRMTPSGHVTEFSLPPPGPAARRAGGFSNSSPKGIVTGPDHNLWIVESVGPGSAIARMTTSGHVTEYPLATTAPPQQPTNIVVGPDGNLWFNATDQMGRITPSGAITYFPIKGNSPWGLAAGADGNLWFTSLDGNILGRMSPTGAVSLFQLPYRDALPIGIAAGADGRMWFTEEAVSKIASIGLTVPKTTFSSRILNFGSNAAATMHLGISNTGDGPLRVTAATWAGPDSALFGITGDTCSGRTVGPGAQCGIEVAISPDSGTGFIAAYLSVTDNATGSPHFVSLVDRLPDCRLPLYAFSQGPGQNRGQFFNPVTGNVTDDPNGGFVADGSRVRSVMTPVLYGMWPASYDLAARRWVPAQTEAVSPDGARYAYVSSDGPGGNHVHVVDVATGRDRVLPVSPGSWGAILAFAQEGIYVRKDFESIRAGLMLVNPDSGAAQTVLNNSPVEVVSGHVAWIGGRDAADTLPEPGGIEEPFNEIKRRDLRTPATTTWIYRPGSSLYVSSATESSVLVSGYQSTSGNVWYVGAPGQAERLTGPELDLQPYMVSRIDGSGVWMQTWADRPNQVRPNIADGLYLWTHRTGPFLVADTVDTPVGGCA